MIEVSHPSQPRLSARRQAPAKRGFTLIELLVVIAIIAILAAILFPVFARARENARRASCQSNLKQIALGVFQYTQDYDEKFPPLGIVAAPASYGWADAVQPYLKSTQIYQCPSFSGLAPSTDPRVGNYTTYALNASLMIDDDGNAAIKSLAYLTQSSLTVMNLDDSASASFSFNMGCGLNNICGVGGLPNHASYVTNRHLGGANYSFCDGHVKWYKGNADYGDSAKVWNTKTPGTTSLSDPTFNPAP